MLLIHDGSVVEAPAKTLPEVNLPNPTVTYRDVLTHAADLIEENGWIRHRERTRDGFCMIGAIKYAADDLVPGHTVDDRIRRDVLFFNASCAARDQVRDALPNYNDYQAIPSWAVRMDGHFGIDKERIGKQNVLKALRSAAR